jgi:hypothetical protein
LKEAALATVIGYLAAAESTLNYEQICRTKGFLSGHVTKPVMAVLMMSISVFFPPIFMVRKLPGNLGAIS